MRSRPLPRRALRGVVLVGAALSAGTTLSFLGCSGDGEGQSPSSTLDAARRPPDVVFDEDPSLVCNDLELVGAPVPARAAGTSLDGGVDPPDAADGGEGAEDAGSADAGPDAEPSDAAPDADPEDASAGGSAPDGGGGAGVVVPELHGGTITDGVYVLSETIVYAGSISNFDAQRETVRVEGETWNNVAEQRGYVTERSTFVFETSENRLSLRNVCHDYADYAEEFSLPYEATPDTIRIEVRLGNDVGHYVYRKQP